MDTLLLIMSIVVILTVYGTILNNLRTGKYELLSWRNIFLMGFAQFYGFGTYYTVTEHFGSDIYVASDTGKLLLTASLPLFLLTYFIALHYGEKLGRPMRKVMPQANLPITDPGILITLAALLGSAFVSSVIPLGGYFTVLISQFKGGLAGAAAGLATYYLIARRFNPIAWGLFLGTFGLCFVIGMVGESGRRGVLGVMMSVGWVWWYFSLKEKPLASKVLRLGAIGAFTFTIVAFYASFRGEGGTSATGGGGYSLSMRADQIVKFMENPTLQRGAIKTMMGSDAPTDTMFIMENYPESYPYDPFNGLVFFLVNPIPRFLWPDKPLGMGVVVQKQLGTPANLGIGIIGHGWSEGGWLGVIGYAAFFGLLIGAIDLLLRERSWNPYFVVAMGCNLGNSFGLARGETSLFLVLIVSSVIGVFGVMYVVKMLFKSVMLSGRPLLTAGNRWILDEGTGEGDDAGYTVDEQYAETDGGRYGREEGANYGPAYEYPTLRENPRVKEAG